MAALISSHRPEPKLPIERYRTDQNFSSHGGVPILDRRLEFPIGKHTATLMRISYEETSSNPEEFGAPVLDSIDYATSDKAKAEMLVRYDPEQHLLLGFWPGQYRSDVFILTNTEHYLRELGYLRERDAELTDKDGNKWVKR